MNNRSGFKRILVLIFMMVSMVRVFAANGIIMISDIKVYAGTNKSDVTNALTSEGYTIMTAIDANGTAYDYGDANKDGGGHFIFIGYKTSEFRYDAITDLMIVEGSDYSGINDKTITYGGKTYCAVNYGGDSKGGNLNRGRGSNTKDIYLYYTKDNYLSISQSVYTSLRLNFRNTRPTDVNSYVKAYNGDTHGYPANMNDGSNTMVFLEAETHNCVTANQFRFILPSVGAASDHQRMCSICGLFDDKGPHTWGEFDQITDAGHSHKCTTCGYRSESVPHDWKYEADLNNLMEQHKKTCKSCNYVTIGQHTWLTTKEPKEATCTEEGWTVGKECKWCQFRYQSMPIEKKAHDFTYVDWVVPTCTEPGHQYYNLCNTCHNLYELTDHDTPRTEDYFFLPATGHKPDEDAWCTVCHDPMPAPLSSLDGWALIVKTGHLYWYATVGYQTYSARLTGDIVDNEGVIDKRGELCADADKVSAFRQWKPIADFQQTFDGQGYSISGLYYESSVSGNHGLFASVGENGTVTGVKLLDSYIKGHDYVGSICGRNLGVISKCYSNSTVWSSNYGGGLVGTNRGQLNHSWFEGHVSSWAGTGGLVGSLAGSIDGCFSNGEVVSRWFRDDLNTYNYRPCQLVGATLGNHNSTVKNSFATSGKYLVNNYPLENYPGSLTQENVGYVTAFQLECGEACWLLNGMLDQDDDHPVWRQRLGSDKTPHFDDPDCPIVGYESDFDYFFNYGQHINPSVANLTNAIRKKVAKDVIDSIVKVMLEKK